MIRIFQNLKNGIKCLMVKGPNKGQKGQAGYHSDVKPAGQTTHNGNIGLSVSSPKNAQISNMQLAVRMIGRSYALYGD